MPPPEEPRALDAAEEAAWRALIRLIVLLPRLIDEDMVRTATMSLTRYVVLMRLSEAPGGALRMSDLAQAASISPSRLTRIADGLVTEGLITRAAGHDDGRVSVATLTPAGLLRLREAWPAHLASVRSLVLDHVDAGALPTLTRLCEQILAASAARTSARGPGDPHHTPPSEPARRTPTPREETP